MKYLIYFDRRNFTPSVQNYGEPSNAQSNEKKKVQLLKTGVKQQTTWTLATFWLSCLGVVLHALLSAQEFFFQIQKLGVTKSQFKTKVIPSLFTTSCQVVGFKSYIFPVHSDLILVDSRCLRKAIMKALSTGCLFFLIKSIEWHFQNHTLLCQICHSAF